MLSKPRLLMYSNREWSPENQIRGEVTWYLQSNIMELSIYFLINTLGCESVFTPWVFSTKTQDFSPMFLKSANEVHHFLKGSK